LEPEYLDL